MGKVGSFQVVSVNAYKHADLLLLLISEEGIFPEGAPHDGDVGVLLNDLPNGVAIMESLSLGGGNGEVGI